MLKLKMSAFHVPTDEPVGKTTGQKNANASAAVKAAILETSKLSPKVRKSIKPGKNGKLLQHPSDWGLIEYYTLYFKSPLFHELVNAMVIYANVKQLVDEYKNSKGTSEITRIGTWTPKELSKHRAILQTILVDYARKNAAVVAGWIKKEISNVKTLCDEVGFHPIDLADWVVGIVLNPKSGIFNASSYVKSGFTNEGNLYKLGIVSTLRSIVANQNKFQRSNSQLLRSVAQALRVQQENSMLIGFRHISKMKPWYAKMSEAAGIEIVGFKYRVHVGFDDKGDPDPKSYKEFTHKTGAAKALEKAKSSAEYVEILSRTPAGRMWLMFDQKGNRPFVAFDRKPQYPMFALNRHDPFNAVLHDVSDINAGLVGFIV